MFGTNLRGNLQRVTVAAVVAVLAAGSGRPAAQQNPPRFRGGVDVIRIEVSVLGKDRKPVRGLTQAEFTVLQDGKPQEIVAFDEVGIRDLPATTAAAWTREVAPEVITNVVTDGRLVLLLLDDGLEPGPFVERTKDIARRVVDHLGPDDRAAVVFTRDNSHAQDFTADRAKLYAAIDHFTTGFVFSQKRKLIGGISGLRELTERRFSDPPPATACTYAVVVFSILAQGLTVRRVLLYYGIGEKPPRNQAVPHATR